MAEATPGTLENPAARDFWGIRIPRPMPDGSPFYLAAVKILKELIPESGKHFWIEPPFYCDYGSNITLGDNVFFNFNCVILDPAKVSIGDNALFGPNVQIYTATHPISYLERRRGLESAKEITIGSDVWIGGGVVIGPGLKIGSRSVIGAGSVLTKDIPEGVFAAGNPCRVLREIE